MVNSPISQVRCDSAFIININIYSWIHILNYSADWFNNSKINCAGLMLK